MGRNYMFHNCKAAVALSKESNDTVRCSRRRWGINGFYFATEDYEWPMGNIQMVGKSNAEAMRGEQPTLTKLSPEWVLSDVARHVVDFWLTTEDLPRPENRVSTGGEGNIHLEAGTPRFGTDPATSVLDVNCKAHELDNLYVVDTSFFPSIAAVNPALTLWPMRCGSASTSPNDSRPEPRRSSLWGDAAQS